MDRNHACKVWSEIDLNGYDLLKRSLGLLIDCEDFGTIANTFAAMNCLISNEMKSTQLAKCEKFLNKLIQGKLNELDKNDWILSDCVTPSPEWYDQVIYLVSETSDDLNASILNPFHDKSNKISHRLKLISKKIVFFTKVLSSKIDGSIAEVSSADLESFHNKLKNVLLRGEKSLLSEVLIVLLKEIEAQLAFCGKYYY